MCTRKGYAASVSQLTLATAALYFKLFKLHSRGKRSVENRRRFHQRLLKLVRVFRKPEASRFWLWD